MTGENLTGQVCSVLRRNTVKTVCARKGERTTGKRKSCITIRFWEQNRVRSQILTRRWKSSLRHAPSARMMIILSSIYTDEQ